MIRFTISPPSLASLADSSGGLVDLVASLADGCCADTEAGAHLSTARAAGFMVPFQEGTRHSTLTALEQERPERVLREFSRHRGARSLDHYSKPRATPEAIVRALGLVPGWHLGRKTLRGVEWNQPLMAGRTGLEPVR